MNLRAAICMLQDHGHHAFVSPEGLHAISTVYVPAHPFEATFVDDCEFEEVHTFKVDGYEVADSDIRDWLGY